MQSFKVWKESYFIQKACVSIGCWSLLPLNMILVLFTTAMPKQILLHSYHYFLDRENHDQYLAIFLGLEHYASHQTSYIIN